MFVVPPGAVAAPNIAVPQQQAASSPLSQQIVTNAQGQIVAIGAAQVNCSLLFLLMFRSHHNTIFTLYALLWHKLI